MKKITFLILSCFLSINLFCSANTNSLFDLIKKGSVEDCKKFIEKNEIDINKTFDKQGKFTPLILSSIYDNLEMCSFLIDIGADVNKSSELGITALMVAARNLHIDLCKFLIKKGANINQIDYEGDSAIFYVIKNPFLNMFFSLSFNQKLLKQLPFAKFGYSQEENEGFNHLVMSDKSVNRILELCKFFIESGVMVNNQDINGMALLHWAIMVGNLQICRFLIENGADIYKQYKVGYSIFLFALLNVKTEICKYLIDAGININEELHKEYNEECPPFIVDFIQNDVIDLIKIVIEYGFDMNKTFNPPKKLNVPKEFCLPLVYAAGINNLHSDMYKLLIHNTDKHNLGIALIMAASAENLECCKQLVENFADVNMQYDYNITPLLAAAEKGNVEICKLLIENGADIHYKTSDGSTALMVAKEFGNIKVCKLLKEYLF
jgi:ankyrin repeat protein